MSMAIGGGAGLGAGAAMNLGAARPFGGDKSPQAAKTTKDLHANNLQARDPKAAKGQQGPGATDKPKDLNRTQAKDQHKAHGADFGRDSAVSRGQGYSQRDSFQTAQKKDQPGMQGQVRQSAGTDAVKRSQQEAEIRMARQVQQMADIAMLNALSGPGDEEIKETLKKMWKRFLEWLKEMDEIFLKPTPQ